MNLERLLLFSVILFLPTQLGLHFWPQFSFVYSLPIDYLSPTFYFWDLLTLLLFSTLILKGGHIRIRALNLLLFFILTQTLSLLFNPASIGVGLVRLEQYLIAGLFGVYMSSAKDDGIKPVIFWAFILSIVGESFLAIAQFLKEQTLGLWIFGERTFSITTPGIAKFDFYGREFLRPYATFPHPNVLAGFMLVGIIFLTTAKNLWKFPKKSETDIFLEQNQTKMVVIGAILLSCVSILLSMSRVVIFGGVIFSALTVIRKNLRILLFIALILLLPILYTRFSSLANFDYLTFVRREELIMIALKIWSSSPFFGVGLNNFIPTASDLLLSGPSRFLQPVHNIFLLSLSETGFAGFAGFILLIGYPIVKLGKLNSVLIIFGMIVFLGMFDHYFLTLPQGYRLLFFIWGLTLRMLR